MENHLPATLLGMQERKRGAGLRHSTTRETGRVGGPVDRKASCWTGVFCQFLCFFVCVWCVFYFLVLLLRTAVGLSTAIPKDAADTIDDEDPTRRLLAGGSHPGPRSIRRSAARRNSRCKCLLLTSFTTQLFIVQSTCDDLMDYKEVKTFTFLNRVSIRKEDSSRNRRRQRARARRKVAIGEKGFLKRQRRRKRLKLQGCDGHVSWCGSISVLVGVFVLLMDSSNSKDRNQMFIINISRWTFDTPAKCFFLIFCFMTCIFLYFQIRRPSNKRATVVAFLGIPYALPPVAARRFQVNLHSEIVKKAAIRIGTCRYSITTVAAYGVDDLVEELD